MLNRQRKVRWSWPRGQKGLRVERCLLTEVATHARGRQSLSDLTPCTHDSSLKLILMNYCSPGDL